MKIPKAWILVKIPEISRIISGATPKDINNMQNCGGIPFYKVSDMNSFGNEKYMISSRIRLSILDIEKLRIKTCPSGTIIFPKRGGAILTNKKRILKSEAAFDLNLMGVVPFINEEYTYYWFQLLDLSKIYDGSNVPQINAKNIEPLDFPLPPLAEQHRIVAKIEELFSDLDAGIASLKQAQAQLKTYRQAVLKYAFEGKLTAAWREQHSNVQDACNYLASIQRNREAKYKLELEQTQIGKTKNPIKDYDFKFQRDKEIPSWAEAALDKLIYIAGRIGWRGLKKEEYTADGPLFLSVHSLNYGKIVDLRDAYHVTDWRYEESPEIKLQENDILLCKDGAGIGKIAIVKNLKERATVNSSLLVIRSREIFLPDFLYYFLNGPELQNVVQSRITGSATPHLFQKDIRRFSLRVPPLDEQHQIVQEIESRLSVCDKLEESIKECLQKAEALRQSILKKAFEGKLVPQDPNDEPAEKLLERIKSIKS